MYNLIKVLNVFALFRSYTIIHKVIKSTMAIQEDILGELTVESITKIIGDLWQGDINILEAKLAE